MQQQVKTTLGTIIILIFAVTAGYILWMTQKNQPEIAQPEQVKIEKKVNEISDSAMSEVEGWQTYRNEEYGFELQYPKGWFVYNAINGDAEIKGSFGIFIQPEKENEGNIPGPHANALAIEIIDYNIALDDDAISSLEGNKSLQYKKEKTIIGGVEGIKATSICEGIGCGSPDWFVVRDGKLFKFYSGLGYSNSFDQILSTFKFID